MNEESRILHRDRPFRSPMLMNRDDSAILTIDVQEKLLPLIPNQEQLCWNITRLLDGAKILDVEVRGTEQYPRGLGKTVESIASKLNSASGHQVAEKTMFSCRECSSLFAQLADSGIHNLLLCGIETHVCVAQTALDLIAQGFNVFVCVDAVGSRHELDHATALRRLESCGVALTTTEAALFEWCEQSGSDAFKGISKLVQQAPPR